MISFRCPKCNNWLNVPESVAGSKETCPTCANVSIVPGIPTAPEPAMPVTRGADPISTGVVRAPRMPDAMKAGLAMYIASFVLGLASGSPGGKPELTEQEAAGLLGVGCIALLVVAADIVGLVMACLGRSWGAILMICTTAIALVLSVASISLFTGAAVCPFVLSNILSVASLICFVVPSAWTFYAESERCRKSR